MFFFTVTVDVIAFLDIDILFAEKSYYLLCFMLFPLVMFIKEK